MDDKELKNLEKKVWISYFDDGLWEIMFGIIFITGYIRTVTDNVWFTGLISLGIVVAILGKWLITVPRLGQVKFRVERLDRKTKLIIVLGILILILPVLFFYIIPKNISTFAMAAWIMAIFSLVAYFLEVKRIYIYGALFAAKELIWGNLGEEAGMYASLVFGIVLLCAGLYILYRFIRRYPKLKEE